MRRPLPAILMMLAVSAFADERLAGSWTLDRSRSDDIDKTINETVRKMNVFTRGIARGRLRRTNPAYANVEISFSDADARITAGPARVVLPLTGAPVRWKRGDGETFTVTGKLQSGTYVETFEAKDGRRTNVFSVAADGRLTMSVTVTSPRLPAPLRYKLVYRRS
jgi:hypothetical protein